VLGLPSASKEWISIPGVQRDEIVKLSDYSGLGQVSMGVYENLAESTPSAAEFR
jgi:hypothetical protein